VSLKITIRQTHRWVSIAFTAGVIANIAAMATLDAGETPPPWVGALALIPLIVLLLSGLYLFALPYMSKSQRAP
jgi:hypothetical protein